MHCCMSKAPYACRVCYICYTVAAVAYAVSVRHLDALYLLHLWQCFTTVSPVASFNLQVIIHKKVLYVLYLIVSVLYLMHLCCIYVLYFVCLFICYV